MIAAINPPRYLQDVIIFTGSGLSTSFLTPVSIAVTLLTQPPEERITRKFFYVKQ